MLPNLLAFFLALVASLVLTPLVRRFAFGWGFVDRPDGDRKRHETPVALGGGAAVFLATLVAVGAAFAIAITRGELALGASNQSYLWALLGSATIIIAVGLFDDVVNLRGRYKLVGQIVAVSVLVAAGLRIDTFSVWGHQFVLGWFAIPFTLFWLLGSINAINLIDGIDGLASTMGLVLCLTLAALVGWMGHSAETILMLSLAGALFGFLRYNFAPASIYLGDAGSMLIGLMIGAAAIFTSTKSAAAVALAVPVAVWSIPILDSLAAIVRRKLTGRSVFAADRGHLHHALLVRGWSAQQAVLFIGLIAATTCLSAVLSFFYENELIALVTVAVMALFLITTKTFGHMEFALLKHRLRFTAHAFTSAEDVNQVREGSIHLQGSRDWSSLWSAMVESAPEYRLVRIMLTISVPALHEAFYANWDCRVDRADTEKVWKVTCPLVVDGQVVGKVEINGAANGGSAFAHMTEVLDYLDSLETTIRQVIEKKSDLEPIVGGAIGDRTGSADSPRLSVSPH